MPTMECQGSVSQPISSSTQAGHSSLRHLSRQRGSMEKRRRRALGWIAVSTGRRGKLAWPTVTPGRAHSSLRSPATPVEARTQAVTHSQTMVTRMGPDWRMPTIVKVVLRFSPKNTDVSTRNYYPHNIFRIGILCFSINLTVGTQFNDIN